MTHLEQAIPIFRGGSYQEKQERLANSCQNGYWVEINESDPWKDRV